MATSTFERKIAITDTDALKRLLVIMESDSPSEPISKHPYGTAERERSENLLEQWLYRSKHWQQN